MKLWIVVGILLIVAVLARTVVSPLQLPTQLLLINMDSRKDRLANFRKFYNASDCADVLPMTRMSAVVGKELNWRGLLTPNAERELEQMLETGKRRGHESLTLGAIGCYLSHLNALERIVRSGRPAIICEDDIELLPNFYERMQAGLQLPPNPDCMVLFHVICGGWEKLKCVLKSENFYEIHQFWSMACYYITPASAEVILAHARPIAVQIDARLSELVQEKKLRIYAYPCVKTKLALGTDIQVPISRT